MSMMAFADGKLDVSVSGRFVKELVLGDQSGEKLGECLALGRGCFLDVEQEIAVIHDDHDAMGGKSRFPNGGGQCGGEFPGAGDGVR